MILITGPSGNVGAELVDLLARQPLSGPIRVANRHPERLVDSGLAACAFDFFDRSTWDTALSGIKSLFLLFPLPGNRAAREAVIPFLHAAHQAGCEHVVYVSVFGADRARLIPHFHVEAALRSLPMSWTVLRCSFFMQNLHRTISTHGQDIVERGSCSSRPGAGAPRSSMPATPPRWRRSRWPIRRATATGSII